MQQGIKGKYNRQWNPVGNPICPGPRAVILLQQNEIMHIDIRDRESAEAVHPEDWWEAFD